MAKQTQRRTVNVVDAARILGLSASAAYRAARRGDLPGVFRIGSRYLVGRDALERVLRGEPSPDRRGLSHLATAVFKKSRRFIAEPPRDH